MVSRGSGEENNRSGHDAAVLAALDSKSLCSTRMPCTREQAPCTCIQVHTDCIPDRPASTLAPGKGPGRRRGQGRARLPSPRQSRRDSRRRHDQRFSGGARPAAREERGEEREAGSLAGRALRFTPSSTQTQRFPARAPPGANPLCPPFARPVKQARQGKALQGTATAGPPMAPPFRILQLRILSPGPNTMPAILPSCHVLPSCHPAILPAKSGPLLRRSHTRHFVLGGVGEGLRQWRNSMGRAQEPAKVG